jgi:rod shape-determining protein MreC
MNSSRTFQTVTLTLLVVGILILALGGYLTPVSRLALAPFIGLQTWISTRYYAIQNLVTAPRDVAQLNQRITALEAEVARLQAQNIELQQQNTELEVLRALLGFAQAHPNPEYLSAAVIGRDTSPFLHYVFINRGSDDGLRRGMPVVSEKGLIGRVAAVTAGAARVQLVTDPAASVNIRIDPAGAEATLHGSLSGEISIDSIPQEASVQPGDPVLTSGLGGNYPANILIGQISGLRRREGELFQTATVQPVTDFARMEIVLVVVNFQPVDITPLVPSDQ